MAFQPWSLPLYLALATLAVVTVWFVGRGRGTSSRWLVTALMASIAGMLSVFVQWIGQGEENRIANQLYPAAVALLLVLGAVLIFVAKGLPRDASTAVRE